MDKKLFEIVRKGTPYKIINDIPRFVLSKDAGQKQTKDSFGYKWEQVNTYDSPQMHDVSRKWLVERYGFDSVVDMQKYMSRSKWILDAGCGSGFSASLWMDDSWQKNSDAQWVGADISSAIDVARKRLGNLPGTHFAQADVMRLPFQKKSFGIIFSEGVLHHTPSTEKALKSLVPLLVPNGEFMFYVYRKKGPVREFSDDYIREALSRMTPKQAWEQLIPLTKLGQAFANLKAEVTIPEDVDLLQIKAGRIDVQRFLYWNVAKMFWNPALSFEENHHINFDWYHPHYAHRQTEKEIRKWCIDVGLRITHFNEQESGFTVRGRRR